MIRSLLLLLFLALAQPAWALEVFATVPEWGALAEALGAGKLRVYTATHALQDPHRIEARPSLMAAARRAQLVLATGADLEVGWLPMVLREAANPAIRPGQPGYFEATAGVKLRDVPETVDRAQGDVHPAGNPHVHLDPRRLYQIAEALSRRLIAIDPAHAADYTAAWADFSTRWQAAMQRWERAAQPLKGREVVVQHASFAYLLEWLGMREWGTLEPKPGVEPSGSYLAGLVERHRQQPARLVLRAAYQPENHARWFAERAGLPVVLLPFTVGGTPAARDLFALFDDSIERLLAAAK